MALDIILNCWCYQIAIAYNLSFETLHMNGRQSTPAKIEWWQLFKRKATQYITVGIADVQMNWYFATAAAAAVTGPSLLFGYKWNGNRFRNFRAEKWPSQIKSDCTKNERMKRSNWNGHTLLTIAKKEEEETTVKTFKRQYTVYEWLNYLHLKLSVLIVDTDCCQSTPINTIQ